MIDRVRAHLDGGDIITLEGWTLDENSLDGKPVWDDLEWLNIPLKDVVTIDFFFPLSGGVYKMESLAIDH